MEGRGVSPDVEVPLCERGASKWQGHRLDEAIKAVERAWSGPASRCAPIDSCAQSN